MMNAKSQEIKTLNQILKKEDIFTRFRLLQLWSIDVFTQSMGKNGEDVKSMVEVLTSDELNEQSEIELIYSKLNIVKKSLIAVNDKLKLILDHVRRQSFIDSLLMKILNETEEKNANSSFTSKIEELEVLIGKNKTRIELLNDMSESKIRSLMEENNKENQPA